MKLLYRFICGVSGLFLLILSISPVFAQGLVWENTCLNSTHLYKEVTFAVDGEDYVINDTVECLKSHGRIGHPISF